MSERIAARTAEMGEQHVLRLLLRYSIPTTIGTAAFTVYNIVDRIFIGRVVGTDAIAGLSITFPVFMVCIAIGMMIGIGSGARASLHLGEGRHEDAERILGNAVALFVLCGAVLSILGHILLVPMLHLFGASSETMPYAQRYMRVLLFFIVFDFLAMGMNGLLRAEGNSRISMMTLVSGSLLNVFLDFLLIVVFDFGVAGAAWATGISKGFSATWILLHFTVSRHRALTLRLATLRLKRRIVTSILHIGISPFIMQFAHSTVIVFMNRSLLKYGGDAAVGAMGAVYSLVMLLIMPTMGLIQGTQPIIGYNYGAKQFTRVRHALNGALLLSFLIAVCGTTIYQLFPGFFLGFFSRGESELVEIGRRGLRILLLLFPLASVQMIISNYFQATGRPLISIILNMLRQVILFLFFLAVLPRFFGLTGIWMVMPCSEALASFFTGTFLVFELKKLRRNE
jgi:putative MATE family efflux protein